MPHVREHASVSCSLFAAPGGSDRASGGRATPFATPQRLIDALHAGQVGCLRGGVYKGAVTVAHGGKPGRPLILRSYPGEQARVVGRLYVRLQARNLSFLDVVLDGRNALALPSPTVFGSEVLFSGDDVTNEHSSICFDLGEAGGPQARDISIERSSIHDCGHLPANNHEHGIYVENANNVRIAWDLIFANADRGIQLYPNAQSTTVVHNVIYGNGEGILFSGAFGTASSNALVAHNVIGDSQQRSNVESWYPAGNPIGAHNLVTDNCIGTSSASWLNMSGGGFSASRNLLVEPPFADAQAGDFQLPAANPCLMLVGDVSAVTQAAQ